MENYKPISFPTPSPWCRTNTRQEKLINPLRGWIETFCQVGLVTSGQLLNPLLETNEESAPNWNVLWPLIDVADILWSFLSLSDSDEAGIFFTFHRFAVSALSSPQWLYICSIDPCPTDAIVALSGRWSWGGGGGGRGGRGGRGGGGGEARGTKVMLTATPLRRQNSMQNLPPSPRFHLSNGPLYFFSLLLPNPKDVLAQKHHLAFDRLMLILKAFTHLKTFHIHQYHTPVNAYNSNA